METYLSLLRGINVSGQKKIPMADLIDIYLDLGLLNPRHYIQSGNIIFHSIITDKKALESLISEGIESNFSFYIPVQIWKKTELENIYLNNPFFDINKTNIKFLHLTLLSETPDHHLVKKILTHDFSPDKFQISDRAIYLFCQEGYGRTKLTNIFFESKLIIQATTRNWKTVGKLVEMLAESELTL